MQQRRYRLQSGFAIYLRPLREPRAPALAEIEFEEVAVEEAKELRFEEVEEVEAEKIGIQTNQVEEI